MFLSLNRPSSPTPTPRHQPKYDPPVEPSHDDEAMLRSTRFEPVRLNEPRLDAFHDVAHAALSQTVREFVKLDGHPVDKKRWRFVRSRAGASVYYERHRADKKQSALLGAGTIKASLADVMEGLYLDTTETTRLAQHYLYPKFVDAEVLKVIEHRSPESPFAFTGLKWAAIKALASGMVSSRDVCYLEKLGVIDISGGRKLGYFIMQSVDLPECPPSLSSKTIRANISLCYLFEETSNGMVGMYMNGSMQVSGPKMLWKMARNNFADVALSVSSAVDVAYAKRCMQLMRSKRHAGEVKQTRGSVCELCHSLPSFFERHRECSGCPKMSVCKKCRFKRDVLHRENHSSLRLARATFCLDCLESVKYPNLSHSKRMQRKSEPEEDEPLVADQRESPRGFKPLYDAESPRRYRNFDDIDSPQGYQESAMASFQSDHNDFGGYEEPDPDSQRSLRMFTLKFQQQLEEIGYDELDASSRHDGLAILGSGDLDRDSDSLSCNSEDEIVASSCVSSLMSTESEETVYNVADYDEEEEEEILSVRPIRRSLQPPEMLEAQTLNPDGSLRPQSTTSSTRSMSPNEFTRSMLSRLEEASLVAEKTYEQLKRSQVFSRSSSRATSTESNTAQI